MKTAHSSNPYDRYSYSLFKSLLNYDYWGDANFRKVITAIEGIPQPQTPHQVESLKASRMGETISNFVRKIERAALADEGGGPFRLNVKSKQIERLWYACESIAACFDERGYLAFIRVAIKEKVSPSIIQSMFGAAKANQVSLPLGYFEGVLAIGVREAIRGRDLKQMELAFERTEACGLQFQTFNWGAFAKDAGEVEDEYVFEVIWSKSGRSQFAFNMRAWVTFSDTAGQVQRGDLIEQVLDAWMIHGDPSDGAVWGSFANAASRVHREDLSLRLWTLAEPFKETFTGITWGSFAKAAGRIGQSNLLKTIWQALLDSACPLDSGTAGTFANAAGDAGQAELLECIWKTCMELGVELDGRGWGSLAHAAGHTNRPDLLKIIFDSWQPKPNTLLEGEHKVWASLMVAALHLDDEALFIEMFRRLASMVDPVRMRNWGSVSDLLWKLAPNIADREVAAEVTETMSGLRLDTSYCFDLLTTCGPAEDDGQEYKPFEGACRCLMRWLVNSYFAYSEEEFGRRVSYLVERMLALPSNRERAWVELLCRSQETYFGCLKAVYYRAYKAHTSFVEQLSDDELLDEIKAERVTASIKEFESKGIYKNSVLAALPTLPPDSPAERLVPLLEYLWVNQRMLLVEKKTGDKKTFFADAAQLLAQAEVEAFSKEDWAAFLKLLPATMSQRVWENLISKTTDSIHNLKNSFYWTFQMPLTRGDVKEEERQEFARYARQFLGDLGNLVGRFSFGETKPISIASLVKATLLMKSHSDASHADVTTPFHIAAWDGARNEILLPLLKEIRFNADKALNSLPEGQRFYHVLLKKGEGEYARFGVLTVSNAYRDAERDSVSTGYGRAIVQKLAASLGGGAVPAEEERDGVRMFTWKVYLPLWTETLGAGQDNA